MLTWLTTISAVGGLFGAAGVALAAAGAHLGANGPLLTTAAYFLLFHAAALIGLTTAAARSRRVLPLLCGASLMALGTLLFAGHLALHALTGRVPLPFAAPVGGSLTIIAWLVVSVALPIALRGTTRDI